MNKTSVKEIVEYIESFVAREKKYLAVAQLENDIDMIKSCEERIFALQLVRANIQD